MLHVKRLIGLIVLITSCCAGIVYAQQNNADILSSLDKGHPRLILKDSDLDRLKKLAETDELLQKCVKDTISRADSYLNRPALVHRLIGPRLLSVSRDCLGRIYALALAYRWTGKTVYADKAIENLLTVCDFKDWNPSHFLDTAEMSHAVGIGYDWLYHYMDEPTREKIKAGLIKNGLEQVYNDYGKWWWARSEHNWNQVCNGGMIAGALAIAETDPKYAEYIIPQALKSLPRAIKSYGPDGAWGEGPGYWSYATHYTAYGIAALQSALGTDFGLLDIEGLSAAGTFPIYMTGPSGYYLNFADVGEKSSRRPMPCMFWLARVFNNPLLSEDEQVQIAKRGASPQHLMWYVPASNAKLPPKSLDYRYGGPTEIAVFRSGWDNPDALFVGVKAGYNQVNHGHLDLGNFELDALGVRWARDLGSDNYNLPGYWDMKRGGTRWNYYRLNSKSHNLVLLGGEDQDPMAKSKFIKFSPGGSMPCVTIDLTQAYAKYASKATRGIAMISNRKAVLVQDEFEITKPCEVAWGMTTDAQIAIDRPNTAELSLDGKKLTARVLSPRGAKFSVESAEQEPPQKANKGVKRLMIRLPETTGELRIVVVLLPQWPDGVVAGGVGPNPLSQW